MMNHDLTADCIMLKNIAHFSSRICVLTNRIVDSSRSLKWRGRLCSLWIVGHYGRVRLWCNCFRFDRGTDGYCKHDTDTC